MKKSWTSPEQIETWTIYEQVEASIPGKGWVAGCMFSCDDEASSAQLSNNKLNAEIKTI